MKAFPQKTMLWIFRIHVNFFLIHIQFLLEIKSKNGKKSVSYRFSEYSFRLFWILFENKQKPQKMNIQKKKVNKNQNLCKFLTLSFQTKIRNNFN